MDKAHQLNQRIKFTALDNTAIYDPHLSWGAKGLLLYLVSRPDGWQFYMKELAKHTNATEGQTARYVAELEKQKYLLRYKTGVKGQKGGICWRWIIEYQSDHEERIDQLNEKRKQREPLFNDVVVLRPSLATTVVGNDNRSEGEYNNTDLTPNTDNIVKTDKDNNIPPIPPKGGDIPKPKSDDLFEVFWKAYTPVMCDGRCTGRGSKHNAKQKFDKAVAQGVTPELLIAKAKEYINDCIQNKRLSKAVATWLNQRCWEDDYLLDAPSIDASEVLYYWNRLANRWALPLITQVSHEQLVECEARLKDSGCDNLHDMFAKLDAALAGSLWLRGRRMRLINGEWECENGDWQPNFNYFLKQGAFLGAIQGGHDDKKVVELKQQGRWEQWYRMMTRDIGDF